MARQDILTRIKQDQEQRTREGTETERYSTQIQQVQALQQTFVSSIATLIGYLDGKTTKTEITNQLKEVGTPDALKVVEAVENLHTTLKTHENVDLSPVVDVMQGVLEETKKIPKELPKSEEQKFIDYTKQYSKLEGAIKAVEEAVRATEVAPIVNVPEPRVTVEAPDYTPFYSGFEAVKEAVEAIKIPEVVFDTSELENYLKKHSELLAEILDKPVGGGGGNAAPSFEESDGTPVRATLTSSGRVEVDPGLVAGDSFDYLGIVNTDTDEDTLTFKTGGSGGTAVRTMVISYATGASKISDDLSEVTYT